MHISTEYKNGWTAHRWGVSYTSNPYDVRAQFVSRAQWSAGWKERNECKVNRREALRHLDEVMKG